MKALLIIDVQNDYFPGGKSALIGACEALDNVKIALQRFREKSMPVIHVQHINTRPGAAFFLPETDGANIHADLSPLTEEYVVVKRTPNSFFQTSLLGVLRDSSITELVICGMMTHMCVDTTVRAAKDYSIPVILLYDACATKDLSIMENTIPAHVVHDAYMAGLNGMFAQVVLTNQLHL